MSKTVGSEEDGTTSALTSVGEWSANLVAGGRRSFSPTKLSLRSREGKSSVGSIEEEKEKMAKLEELALDLNVTVLPNAVVQTAEREAAVERQLLTSNAFYQRLLKTTEKSKHDSSGTEEYISEIDGVPTPLVSQVELRFGGLLIRLLLYCL
jgi:hypothetical protein